MNNPCGCKIVLTDDRWTNGMADFHADISYCSLHTAAPAMLEALKKLVFCIEKDSYLCHACNEAIKAAIRAAEEKPEVYDTKEHEGDAL